MKFLTTFATLALITTAASRAAETPESPLTLAAPFANHAVLQQGIALPIWGTARPGASIKVRFADQTKTTTAGEDGAWRVTLDPLKAIKLRTVNDVPEGHTLTLTSTLDGRETSKTLTDLLIGDVWLCAGQSNIAGRMRINKTSHHPANSIELAHYPALRMLGGDEWLVCSPETAPAFGRVAFFFARRLQQDALIPVGLMITAVGGSNIESWLNQPPGAIGKHYTELVEPLVGYGIRGAIWYQGESNQNDGRAYQPKLKSLIEGWRNAWGQDDFPVHYVQLPGLGESPTDNPAMGDGRAGIRQAYVDTLAIPNTGLAVTLDIGTKGEHPPNKYDTGDRLARSVLRKVYGMETITACPLYQSHKIEGSTVRVSFTDDAKGGLMIAKKATTLPDAFHPPTPTPDAKLDWLSIQDAEGTWHWADAKIDGSELIVSAPGVANPVAVRYACTAQPIGHLLYNTDGMPVGPFIIPTPK